MSKAELAWEAIDHQRAGVYDDTMLVATERAKIPGGWLVRSRIYPGLTFVPDATHRWDGKNLA